MRPLGAGAFGLSGTMRTTEQGRRKEGKLMALDGSGGFVIDDEATAGSAGRRGHVLRVQGIRITTAGRNRIGDAVQVVA